MKTVIRKLFVNFEKEEKWLNEMAAKGLNLVKYSFGKYTFEEGTPGEYIYRLQLLDKMPSDPESKDYIEFMEDAGIECVETYMRWAYFRKKLKDGAFNLYSDNDSKIKYYKKVTAFIGILGLINLVAAIVNVLIGLGAGQKNGIYFNIYVSIFNWSIVIILVPMFISYINKIRKLIKEKQLYQ